MNDSVKRISLDIHSTSSRETVNAKRGDTGRRISISLVDGGIPYTISEDCYAVFTAKKPDGNVVYNDCIIENNTIIYEVTEQTVAVEGRVNCEIKLYGVNNKLITSPKFTIAVYGTVYNEGDEVESSDEFSALTKLMGDTLQATENANNATDRANHTAKACMVIGIDSGSSIFLNDATDIPLAGCRIFGKTTQNGTPTPDAPIAMVSAGDSGSIGVTVSGNNVLNTAELTNGNMTKVEVSDDGYTIVATGGTKAWANADFSLDINHIRGRTVHLSYDSIASAQNVNSGVFMIYRTPSGTVYPPVSSPIAIPDDVELCVVRMTANNTGTALSSDNVLTIKGLRVSIGRYQQWEPHKTVQTLSVSTPNGLRGIPVSTGGNYTDENGQRWSCDEIDFARGKHVQWAIRASGLTWTIAENDGYPVGNSLLFRRGFSAELGNTTIRHRSALCNKMPYDRNCLNNDITGFYFSYGTMYARIEGVSDVGTFNSLMVDAEMVIELDSAIETPLSEEEILAYKALHTHKDNVTISNDAWTFMEIQYVMDAKKYIDSLLQPTSVRIAQVKLLASAWVGSGNLYSQVVSIDGITENSQVNLTPSVLQLSIFYEKDITFITENDGGVVTVYVIGQKPENDYTIQADIVEVVI